MPETLILPGKYIRGLGRRKRATAQVRLYPEGTGKINVNGKDLSEYLPLAILQDAVKAPLVEVGLADKVDITVRAVGGGIRGQAEAIRLGISRALVTMNEDNRVSLRTNGFLTRDARKRERKKPGLKSARRAPQFSKR